MSPEDKAKFDEVNRQREAAITRNKAVEANNKGVEFQKDGKNSEAMKAFKDALTVDPSYELARQNLAVSYYNLGGESVKQKKWAEAIEHYELARSYDKSMRERSTDALAGSYNNKAAELVEAKRLDEAVAAMEKASELNPKYQPELVNLKNYREQLAAQQKSKEKPAKPAAKPSK